MLRLHDYFYTVVLLVHKDIIRLGRVVEPYPMRDDVAGINIALLNPFKQGTHITLDVCLSGSDLQCLVRHRAEMDFIEKPTGFVAISSPTASV